MYALMRHGHDPEEAVIRRVNDAKDKDTSAAVAGLLRGRGSGGSYPLE
jgi:hypothetical protein